MTHNGTAKARIPPKRSRDAQPSALALIEESVHLLRRAPAGVFLFHLLGPGTWVLAVLFAWAYVSWFRPGRDEVAAGAAVLCILYAWMKVAQSEMCARLMAVRLGTTPEKFTLRRAARLASAQFGTHAWGPAALLVSGVLTVPLGYAWLYFQTVTVLGADRKTIRAEAAGDADSGAGADAWSLAKLWPRQGHVGLLVISLLALVVFANIAAAFYMIPWLARTLLGMENFMTLSGWSMLNTTFLMCVTGLAWLAVDPLAKAFCVLRVFRGRALRTGEDLRIEMAAARKRRRAVPGAAMVALAGVLVFFAVNTAYSSGVHGECVGAAVAQAAEPVRISYAGTQGTKNGQARRPALHDDADQPISPAELDRAIDEVLARRDFQWQLQPQKNAGGDGENTSAIERFFNWLGRGVKSVVGAVRDFVEWLVRLIFEGRDDDEPVAVKKSSGGAAAALLKIFLCGLMIVLVVLLVWVVFTTWRGTRRKVVQAAAVGGDEAAPDLRDDDVQAAQLPSDGWLQLAREQAALGEWRLALRALYLAHLARLGAEGLLTLRRHKTNLDYERELRRRALQRAGLPEWFSARRREFESVWYGCEQTGEARVREWFDEVEKGARP